MAFKHIVEKVRRRNAQRLKSTVHSANALAKITEADTRRALYTVKSRAVTRLLEMRMALVGEMLFEADVIIGLWFEGGGGSHVRFRDLSRSGQEIVLQQVNNLLPTDRPTNFTDSKQSQENSNEFTKRAS